MNHANCTEILKMKGIKMVNINICSLFNKVDQLRTSFHGMDIIVVSETWLTSAIIDVSISIYPVIGY